MSPIALIPRDVFPRFLRRRIMSKNVALPMLLTACASLAAAQGNADLNYRALRDAAPTETYGVENIELKRDGGTLTPRTGQLTFLAPVLNQVSMAVFNGEFRLKPAIALEER
jgi:hypothetical protein